MRLFTYLIALLISVIVNFIIVKLDVAYFFAAILSPDNDSHTVLLAGLLSVIFTGVPYVFNFYFADKISKKWEFKKSAAASGMSEFEYAKSITPENIISYCDSHLDDPIYEIIVKLDALPNSRVISRPCADALIEGYTELMKETQSRYDK